VYSISREGRLMLFNALIMPYFAYGIELWFTCSKLLRGSVELLLRHCLRVVVNDIGPVPRTHNVDLHVMVDILPLSLLFQLRLGQMVFKLLRLKACPPLQRLLEEQRSCQGSADNYLRCRQTFRIPLVRAESCRACFKFYGCELWNHLHPCIRDTCTFTGFTTAYREYLIDRLESSSAIPCESRFYSFI
jgi:hypothetical protein